MNRAIPSLMNRTIPSVLTAAALLLIPFTVAAQDAADPPSNYVSRAEYDKLKADHEAMKKELEALKTLVNQMASGAAPGIPAEGPRKATPEGKQVVTSQGATDDLRQEVETLKAQVKETFP